MCPGRPLGRLLKVLPALLIATSVLAADGKPAPAAENPAGAKPAAAAKPAASPAAPAAKPAAKTAPAIQAPATTEPPPISRWIDERSEGGKGKAAEILKRVLDEQENVAVADLADPEKGSTERKYRFFAVTLLPAWLSLTREVLTDYVVFKEIVPFVESASFDEKAKVLELIGGVMGFTMHSLIRFTEKHERWIGYEIIAGSFRGMKGDLVFEAAGEKGTVVMLTGELSGFSWPPAIVMERGAEIALTVTAGNMRSYIIERKRSNFDAKKPAAGKPPKGKGNDEELPQPRNRL